MKKQKNTTIQDAPDPGEDDDFCANDVDLIEASSGNRNHQIAKPAK